MNMHMSVTRRATVLALATGALAIAVSGCASGNTGSGGSVTTATFVTYGGEAAITKYKDLIAEFEKQNPNDKIKLQTLAGDDNYNSIITSRISSNTAPDVFEVLNGVVPEKAYVKAGLLTDLSDQPWVSTQSPALKQAVGGVFGGKTYQAIPDVTPVGLYYNVDLFKQYGLTPPTNWDEFTTAVKTLRSHGITPLASGGKDGYPLTIQALTMAASMPDLTPGSKESTGLASGKLTYSSSDSWKKVLDDFASLTKESAYDPDMLGVTDASAAADFGSGKAGMMIHGAWELATIRQANKDVNVKMIPVPYVSSGTDPILSLSLGSTLAIPKNAPHADVAKKLLAFLLSKSALTKFVNDASSFPTQPGVTPSADPALADVSALVVSKNAREYNLAAGLSPAAQAALQSGLQQIIAGTADPTAVLKAMDQAQVTS